MKDKHYLFPRVHEKICCNGKKSLPKLSHNYCPNMLLCLLINCTNIQTSCVRCNIGLYVVTFRPWLMQYAQWLHFLVLKIKGLLKYHVVEERR